MVREYETESGYYEYMDEEGFRRIGRWEQKYVGDRGFYSPGDPLMNRKKVGIVDFYEDDDDEYLDGQPDKRRECPHCLEYDLHNKLGARIVEKGQQRPVDWEEFLQCYYCFNIFPRHEIAKEKTLKVDVERHTEDNPFDVKKGIVLGIPKRSSPAGKKASAKRKREKQRVHHSDPEVDREIQQHGEDNVKILYDSTR